MNYSFDFDHKEHVEAGHNRSEFIRDFSKNMVQVSYESAHEQTETLLEPVHATSLQNTVAIHSQYVTT